MLPRQPSSSSSSSFVKRSFERLLKRMSHIDVKERLLRADRCVGNARAAFEASIQRRKVVAEDDSFLSRMMMEATKLQRERAIGPVISKFDQVTSNRSKIQEMLSSGEVNVGADSRKLARGEFSVDLRSEIEQRPIETPAGVWCSKEIVVQREYDVDAANNQEPDSDNEGQVASSEKREVDRVLQFDVAAPVAQAEEKKPALVSSSTFAHELASLFNRLVSNDLVFSYPDIDEYNSTHFDTKYHISSKTLSLANGRLQRSFFDSSARAPSIAFSTKTWNVRRQILERILKGDFDLQSVALLYHRITELESQVEFEHNSRTNCERELLFERARSKHLLQQMFTQMNERREYNSSILRVAADVDFASSTLQQSKIPALSRLVGRTLKDDFQQNEHQIFEDIRCVLEHVGNLRRDNAQCLDSESWQKVAQQWSVSDAHLKKLESWSNSVRKRNKKELLERKFEAMERTTMELEDSRSGLDQLFLVGENLYAKMGSIARILTPEQRSDIFGKDLTTIQFFELTRARNSICPLCRFEFDATQPLSSYAQTIEEKTRAASIQIRAILGRKGLNSSHGSDLILNRRKSEILQKKHNDTATISPDELMDDLLDPTLDTFETQVAVMALHQMNVDLEEKLRKMQELLDEATATIRLEKMHFATLDSKYKETIRETGDYRKKFDAELKRSNEMTEMFRQECCELREELTQRRIRIEELEDINQELKHKMVRQEHAENQINTLRFGFPMSATERADLSFQEIGYVYYRKYYEVSTQLRNLKSRFNLDPPQEVVMCDVGVGGNRKVESVSNASTNCLHRELISMIDRAHQVFPSIIDCEQQTDDVRFIQEVDTTNRDTQTMPFAPVISLSKWPKEIDCDGLLTWIQKNISEVAEDPISLNDLFLCVKEKFQTELTAGVAAAKTALSEELLSKEPKILEAGEVPKSITIDDVVIQNDVSSDSDVDDEQKPPKYRPRKFSSLQSLIKHEVRLRSILLTQSETVSLSLVFLQGLWSCVLHELKQLKCRRQVCSTVNVEFNGSAQNVQRQRLIPGPESELKVKPQRDFREREKQSRDEQKKLVVTSLQFNTKRDDETLATWQTPRSETPNMVPALPFASTPHSNEAARRFVKQDRKEHTLGSLVIKSIAARISMRNLTRALTAEAAPQEVCSLLEEVLHRTSKKLTNLEEERRDRLDTQKQCLSPPIKQHGLTSSRCRVSLLAARLQSQQRLATPDADLSFASPVVSLKSVPVNLDTKAVLGGEHYFPSFLPRPLPPFRGAIPPTTITGTAQDSALKKPSGGFVEGWHDSVQSAQRLKLLSNSVALRLKSDMYAHVD